MSEINERWKRDHRYVQRLTAFGAIVTVGLWAVSYFTGGVASWDTNAGFIDGWFGFTSSVTFLGAVGTTIGTGVGIGRLLTDDPPLTGSNY